MRYRITDIQAAVGLYKSAEKFYLRNFWLYYFIFISYISFFAASAWASDEVPRGQSAIHQSMTLDIRNSYGDFKTQVAGSNYEFDKTHNNASRIGLNGSYEERSLIPYYNVVSGLDLSSSDVETRKFISLVGIKNANIGNLAYGRMSTPYKVAGLRVDPFYDTAAGVNNAGNNFGLSEMTRGFSSRSLMYSSPRFGGVEINFGVVGTGEDYAQSAGFKFNAKKWDLGLQYLLMRDDLTVANAGYHDEAFRMHGQYAGEGWKLGTSIEYITNPDDVTDRKYLYISAVKNFSKSGYFAISYGSENNTKSHLIDRRPVAGDGKGATLGVFYNVVKWLQIYALGSTLDYASGDSQTSLVSGVAINYTWGNN